MRQSTAVFVILGGFVLAEFAVFVWVAGQLGFGTALMLSLATSLLGIAVIANRGRSQVLSLRSTFISGGSVALDLSHGAMILAAGILLFVPGFLTDLIGLILLLPPVRAGLWQWRQRRRANRVEIL